jgi:hypothetical protein
VDPEVIARTRRALSGRQQADGSWAADQLSHSYTGPNNAVAQTAYVTWALLRTGRDGTVDGALAFLARHLDDADLDTYGLALMANAFAAADARSTEAREAAELLDGRKVEEAGIVRWTSGRRTLMYGSGDAADVETTALATLALLRSGRHGETAQKALNYLVRQRQPDGAWITTQATVLALQALTAASEGGRGGTGTVRVRVNGREAGGLEVTEQNADVAQQLDLTPFLSGGSAEVALSIDGRGEPLVQLVSRSYVPWRARSTGEEAEVLDIRVRYDRTQLQRNDIVTAEVTLRSNAREALSMVIADVGLAPGFTPDTEGLDRLVRARLVERYEVTPRQLILYLETLRPGQTLRLPVRLRARFPVRAVTPPSTVYEYYNPDNRRSAPPQSVAVM